MNLSFILILLKAKNIGELNELIIIAKQNDLDERETYDYINSDEDKEGFKYNEEQARRIGIKGVPCFIINKQFVLFGAQDPEKFINLFKNLKNTY